MVPLGSAASSEVGVAAMLVVVFWSYLTWPEPKPGSSATWMRYLTASVTGSHLKIGLACTVAPSSGLVNVGAAGAAEATSGVRARAGTTMRSAARAMRIRLVCLRICATAFGRSTAV